MNLSTRGRYATRIMLYLAAHEGAAPVSVGRIGVEEGIARDYAEQLLLKLKAAGLVESRRGAAGGFVLGRPAGAISVADILEAVEGPSRLVPCVAGVCARRAVCMARGVWEGASGALLGFLKGQTLEGIVRQAARGAAEGDRVFEI